VSESEDRHRFARRLEAFSDIVFGFALAQSAFALEIPKTLAEVNGKLSDLFFFAITFALIAIFWTMHYRVFHYVFDAEKIDVLCNFALLAAVALLPYALRLYLKFPQSMPGSVAYAATIGGGFGLLAILEVRGLLRKGVTLSPKVLVMIRKAAWRHSVAGGVLLASLPLFAFIGLEARYVWGLVPLAIIVVRVVERVRGTARGTPAVAAES
jgi:uncharacterized membrane protein